MIKLSDLKGYSALSKLENYTGINPYIKKLRNDYLRNKKIVLTAAQTNYIVENYDKEPILINRVLSISKFLGEELQKQAGLSFTPERVLVEYLLADTDKTFHVYGKLKRNQIESAMYWLPKTQVIDDPYFENIDVPVDFTKYNDILKQYNKQLYNHQETGVKFLLSRKGAILADDMGLGKSIQSIIAALESGAENILVVCPASVKLNWEREIKPFCKDVSVITSQKWKKAKFTIINFDILKNFHTIGDGSKEQKETNSFQPLRHLVNAKFDLIIIDEAHSVKDSKRIRSEIIVELTTKYGIDKVWLLTGTPISNRPMDFFNLLKIIKTPISENWKFFTERYCSGRQFYKTMPNGKKKKIWLTDGASNLDELANKTKNYILRRLKTEVLDMPDKVITPVYYQLTKDERLEYDELWDNYLIERKRLKKRGSVDKDLVELILLRKFIAQVSIKNTIELAENAIELGKKVVIFTNFNDEQRELAEHFNKICVVHNGSMSANDKQRSVDAFQEKSKIKVFIGNIKSAGVGITLTEGTVVIFNSFEWVPGWNEQAEDRTYRIGQKNDVNVFYQLFEDTISIRMWDTLKNKQEVISELLDGKDMTDEEKIALIAEKILESDGEGI